MILPGQMIRMRGIFSPFCERQVSHGLSYGLSCAGYDVRLKNDVTLVQGHTIVAPILDHIDMPPDLLGMVADKSTWARQGVQVQHTVIEPGWRGTLAIELTYQPLLNDDWSRNVNNKTKLIDSGHPHKMKIEAGSPIAQVLVHQLLVPAELPYDGKYQDQRPEDIGAKMEQDDEPEEISEEKIYEDEATPIKRDVAGVLMRNGLWVNWDEDRQTWLGRAKDVKKIKGEEESKNNLQPWWRLTDEERQEIISKYGPAIVSPENGVAYTIDIKDVDNLKNKGLNVTKDPIMGWVVWKK